MNKEKYVKISKDVFPEIRKILGLKNLKCYFCKKQISKRNFGILSKDFIICKDIVCVIRAMIEFKIDYNKIKPTQSRQREVKGK